VKTHSIDTYGVNVGVYECDAGEGQPTHVHPSDDHTHTVIRGRSRVVIGEETKEFVPEDGVVVLPMGVPHSLTAVEDGTVWINVIQSGGTRKTPIYGAAVTLPAQPPPQTWAGVQLDCGQVVESS